ncbi:hypothetical protein ACOSQ3_008385 [Xanthoceras sorbifolium]
MPLTRRDDADSARPTETLLGIFFTTDLVGIGGYLYCLWLNRLLFLCIHLFEYFPTLESQIICGFCETPVILARDTVFVEPS